MQTVGHYSRGCTNERVEKDVGDFGGGGFGGGFGGGDDFGGGGGFGGGDAPGGDDMSNGFFPAEKDEGPATFDGTPTGGFSDW